MRTAILTPEGGIFKLERGFLFIKEGKRFEEERHSTLLQKHSISQPNHIENKFPRIITKKFIGWNYFWGNRLSKRGLREIVNVKKGTTVERNLFTTHAIDRMQACKDWRTFLNFVNAGFIPETEERFLFAKEGKVSAAENYFILSNRHGMNQFNHIDYGFFQDVMKEVIDWNSFFENKLSTGALKDVFFYLNNTFSKFSGKINAFRNDIENSVADRQNHVLKGNRMTSKYKESLLKLKEIITVQKEKAVQKHSWNFAYVMNQMQTRKKQNEFLYLADTVANRMISATESYFILRKHTVDYFSSRENKFLQTIINEVIKQRDIFQKRLSEWKLQNNIYKQVNVLNKNIIVSANGQLFRLLAWKGETGFLNFWNNIVRENATQILKEGENRYESTYINDLGKIEFGKERKEGDSFSSDIFHWIPEKTGKFLSVKEGRESSGEMVYFIKRGLDNGKIIKIQKQMQDIAEGLKQDVAEEMHKNVMEQRTIRLLEEEIARQRERIQELELMHKKIQESFWNMKDIQKEENNYLKVFGNEIKLERMRYGIPH